MCLFHFRNLWYIGVIGSCMSFVFFVNDFVINHAVVFSILELFHICHVGAFCRRLYCMGFSLVEGRTVAENCLNHLHLNVERSHWQLYHSDISIFLSTMNDIDLSASGFFFWRNPYQVHFRPKVLKAFDIKSFKLLNNGT